MTEECPRCGGPNPVGASVCQWCGTTLGASLPLPSAASPPTAYRTLEFSPPATGAPGPPGGTVRGPPVGAIIAVVFVVVILLVFVVALASMTSTPSEPGGFPGAGSIEVTGVTVSSPDNACGLNGVTSPGFSSSNLPSAIGWGLPENGHAYPCTVTNVTTDTPGFSAYASLPLTVTAPDTVFMVSLGYPTSFSGSLHLIIN